MTTCEEIRELLGPYVDGEAAPDERREVETHVSACPACSEELDETRNLAEELGRCSAIGVPSGLWSAIELRLDDRSVLRPRFISLLRSRSMLAIAAGIVIVIGLGLFGLPWRDDGGTQVQAATVDFSILLDELQHDAVAAFEKFLAQYQARTTTPTEAKQYAPELDFDVPPTLPGGFALQAVYTLRFGSAPGVAARYSRDGEFLGVLFHPPVLREHFGTHQDRHCIVGQHRGHSVPVGEWSLVHLTDPTTCHCVLSRLDEDKDLPAVMVAVAPSARESGSLGDPP